MGAAFRKKKRREHRRTSYAVPPPEGVTPDDLSPGGDTTGLVARCWAPCKKCGGAPRPVVVGACDDGAHFVCEHHLILAVGVSSVAELRAKGGTFKCSICPPGASKRGNAYPEHAPNPWTTTCGVCEEPLGAVPKPTTGLGGPDQT